MTHPLVLLLETISASCPMAGELRRDGDGRPPDDRSELDLAALLLSLFEESQRINETLFRLMVAPLMEYPARNPVKAHEPDRTPSEDPLAAVLTQARRWVVQYPVLAQAVYAALIAEGRRYGRTAEGARWAQALHRSKTVHRSRPLFEAVTTNLSEDAESTVLPSMLLQAVREVAAPQHLDVWLSLLRHGGHREEA